LEKLTVIICILNEENRLKECLDTVVKNNPNEIIVVDGGSKDKSIEIAKSYDYIKIIESSNSNLTRDRQKGIDAASNEYIALIDADHRLEDDSLDKLVQEMKKYSFHIGQSQLKSYINYSWLNKAEEEMWDLTHNESGPRNMIGVAPAIYKKEVFNKVKFDDNITKTIDDTDFIYRLSLHNEFKYGILDTKVAQLHEPSFSSYMKKFKWYGIGDGEFCFKHKDRMFSMLYHLLIRYPIIYSLKGLLKGKFYVIPFLILQGFTRFYFAIITLLRLYK
jgi:glycosyltransferase involved in cell wall biosynthesis